MKTPKVKGYRIDPAIFERVSQDEVRCMICNNHTINVNAVNSHLKGAEHQMKDIENRLGIIVSPADVHKERKSGLYRVELTSRSQVRQADGTFKNYEP